MGRECGTQGSGEEYVQRIRGIIFSPNTLRNHLHVMVFVITSHVGVRKNLIRLPIHHRVHCFTTLIHFSLDSVKLDPAVIRKTDPRSTLVFREASGLGKGTFLQIRD
jgi:hypothetical protein